LHKHFKKILEEAVAVGDIDDERATQLVPYSMRHFCITQRIMAGLSYSEVGEAAGTSVYQIEKTYYHLNDAMKRKYATADYKLVDGVPKPLL
jgi:integrase